MGLRIPLCFELGRELLGVELAVLLVLELAEWGCVELPIVLVLLSRVQDICEDVCVLVVLRAIFLGFATTGGGAGATGTGGIYGSSVCVQLL